MAHRDRAVWLILAGFVTFMLIMAAAFIYDNYWDSLSYEERIVGLLNDLLHCPATDDWVQQKDRQHVFLQTL
jgi:hypothetical protein